MRNFTAFFSLLFIINTSIFAQTFPTTEWIDFAETGWYNAADDPYKWAAFVLVR